MNTSNNTTVETKTLNPSLTQPLVIDALVSLVFGAALVLWSDKLASLIGIEPFQIVHWLGWGVLAFATFVGVLVVPPKQRRVGTVKILVIANALWSIAALGIVIAAPLGLNGWGLFGVGLTGVFTAVMGWWEYRLLE